MTTELMDPKTGEVVTLAKYDPREYVASLTKQDGLATQKALSAAYDAACAALIGPNDVQVEGTRSFKKKSAWRKLARYFTISVEIVKVERDVLEPTGHFLATVTARAVAPWGQSYEEVGACCTDEATGRRVITVADAIATASTRASNRAVSNLIAMGEVSAEEIGDRPARADGARSTPAAQTPRSGNPVMPFGKTKGQALALLPLNEIESALSWARAKGKFSEFQADAEAEIARRMNASEEQGAAHAMADDIPGVDDGYSPNDDLPF